ncbi:hypothetical protein [Lutimonas sp.]|uniref:hypothetical protein n=1 Tax=Lutimonas sp. TaxID=1872403 RepID=UPI003D9AD74F
MAYKNIYEVLAIVKNAKRSYRDQATEIILGNPLLFPDLVEKTFDVDDPLHIKAAWVLELVCIQDCSLLNDYILEFIQGMPTLTHESALRPVSKICSLWSAYYFLKKTELPELKAAETDCIIACNFDWLIEEHKVACQVFAMDTLKLWAKEQTWIQEELRLVLQKNADSGTKGYRAHARKLLKNL